MRGWPSRASDRVVPPSELDMQLMNQLPVISDAQLSALGAEEVIFQYSTPGEFHRNAVLSPSCTICGLASGYQGEGQKTIVPSRASAKLDFRLVPDQTPEEILDKLRKHLDSRGFKDIQATSIGTLYPSRTPVDHPLVRMVTGVRQGRLRPAPAHLPDERRVGTRPLLPQAPRPPRGDRGGRLPRLQHPCPQRTYPSPGLLQRDPPHGPYSGQPRAMNGRRGLFRYVFRNCIETSLGSASPAAASMALRKPEYNGQVTWGRCFDRAAYTAVSCGLRKSSA